VRHTQRSTTLALLLVLGAVAGPVHADLTTTLLRWTAPGDDGLVGRAAQYDLRYSDRPITSATFSQCARIPMFAQPSPPGQTDSVLVSGLNPALTYYFAIKTSDEAGNWSALSNVLVKPSFYGTTDVNSGLTLAFSNPWPNPSRSDVRVAFTLPSDDRVSVDVFDLSGRLVQTLAHGPWRSGRSELTWDLTDLHGRHVSAGMYLVRAQLAGTTFTRRCVIVR